MTAIEHAIAYFCSYCSWKHVWLPGRKPIVPQREPALCPLCAENALIQRPATLQEVMQQRLDEYYGR